MVSGRRGKKTPKRMPSPSTPSMCWKSSAGTSLHRPTTTASDSKCRSRYCSGPKFVAFPFRLVPKFGPLSTFQFHGPTLNTEQLFADSLKVTVENYEMELQWLRTPRFDPLDVNPATGQPTRSGAYRHADQT